MIAFAANSVLCRAALRPADSSDTLIDPAGYTLVRLVSGAFVLLLIQYFRKFRVVRPEDLDTRNWGRRYRSPRVWLSPLLLFVYAVCFSFAYIGLDTASGTLILFAFVQITMVLIGLTQKEFPRAIEILGLLVATAGLIYLVLPNLQTPLLKESLMMTAAGIAWGAYSYLGKKSADPISNTAFNFACSVPFAIVVLLIMIGDVQWTTRGVLLAIASGGLASGLGYVLWYSVLPDLKSTQAAAVQLSVPIVAALGGVLFIGDELSSRTLISGAVILLGIGLTIKWIRPPAKVAANPDVQE